MGSEHELTAEQAAVLELLVDGDGCELMDAGVWVRLREMGHIIANPLYKSDPECDANFPHDTITDTGRAALDTYCVKRYTITPAPLTFAEYQRRAQETAIWEGEQAEGNNPLYYCTMGLVGEAGEIANKVKKVLRSDYPIEDIRDDLGKELGDVGWYLAALCTELGLDFADIMQGNLDKLASRKERGVIKGSGDER